MSQKIAQASYKIAFVLTVLVFSLFMLNSLQQRAEGITQEAIVAYFIAVHFNSNRMVIEQLAIKPTFKDLMHLVVGSRKSW